MSPFSPAAAGEKVPEGRMRGPLTRPSELIILAAP